MCIVFGTACIAGASSTEKHNLAQATGSVQHHKAETVSRDGWARSPSIPANKRAQGKGFHVNHDDGDQDGDHGLWNNNPYRHEEELSGSEEQETELGLDAASGARKKSSGDDDDSDDYYNGLVSGLEGADAKEKDTPYRPDPQSGHEAGGWTPHAHGEPEIFRWEESLSLTESSSLSNSIISVASRPVEEYEAVLCVSVVKESPGSLPPLFWEDAVDRRPANCRSDSAGDLL
jgi:hypothetical protein